MNCPTGDGNPCQPGQSLCLDCVDRLYQELRWLAAIYPQLLSALTHRVNVEHVDRDKVVRVAGGKDPMVRGLNLHEDALQLRVQIRRLALQGVAWTIERGLDLPGGISKDPAKALRYLGRNLHWVLSDDDSERVVEYAAWAVALRQDAETLVTPEVGIRKTHTRQECGVEDASGEPCPGELVIWGSNPLAVCQINPQHVVSRETLIFRLVKQNLQYTHQRRS